MFLFCYGCTLRGDTFLVLCRVLNAKVVGATSSEGFEFYYASLILLDMVLSSYGNNYEKYVGYIVLLDCMTFVLICDA